MTFVHKCNKNNRHDTMRNKFVWHSKILTNLLRLISLFIDINEMAKAYKNLFRLKSLANQSNPALRKELRNIYLDCNHFLFESIFNLLFKCNYDIINVLIKC